MKLSAIKKLCMESGSFYIMDAPDGRQWFSNGFAAWPIDGVRVTENSVPALFDLTEDQVGKLFIREMTMPDERFQIEPMNEDMELKDSGMAVWSAGDLYRVLESVGGLLFLPVSCIKPAEYKKAFMRYFERTHPSGEILIAAFADLTAGALVKPANLDTVEQIMAQVRNIAFNDIRTTAAPKDEEDQAEAAGRAAEEAMRKSQQEMDFGEDEGDEPD